VIRQKLARSLIQVVAESKDPRHLTPLSPKPIQRHVIHDDVVRDQGILSRFAAVFAGVLAGAFTPFLSDFFLGEHHGVFHLVLGFGFEHVDDLVGFGYEVGLILRVVGTGIVKDLELGFGRA